MKAPLCPFWEVRTMMTAFTKDVLFPVLCCMCHTKIFPVSSWPIVQSPKPFLAWYFSPLPFSLPRVGSHSFSLVNSLFLPDDLPMPPTKPSYILSALLPYIICLNHKCSLLFCTIWDPVSRNFPWTPQNFRSPTSKLFELLFLYHSFSIDQIPSCVDICVFSNDCLTSPDELQTSRLIHSCILPWALHRVST